MATGAEAPRPLRLGVFGGTFDPPHVAHVSVARDVADALALDRILWIPARVPPHKLADALTPGPLRLEMVRAAVGADARFEASAIELEREGPSWTVDTLRTLRASHPAAELFLVLGADQVRTLATGWREPEEVLRLATLVLIDREGEEALGVAPDLPGIERAAHVRVRRVDLSSTRIREAVARGEDASDRLPAGVWEVIRRERLYGCVGPLIR